MKKIIIIMMLILLIFTGCKSRTKTLLDSDCIRITQEGGRIVIYDVLSDTSYTFIIRHKRPPERTAERTSVTKTEHIEILKCTKKIILKDLINDEFYTICIGKIFPRITVKEGGEY